jgi:hypothetical protein
VGFLRSEAVTFEKLLPFVLAIPSLTPEAPTSLHTVVDRPQLGDDASALGCLTTIRFAGPPRVAATSIKHRAVCERARGNSLMVIASNLNGTLDAETLRALVVSDPWDTFSTGGEEVDVDLLFSQSDSQVPVTS